MFWDNTASNVALDASGLTAVPSSSLACLADLASLVLIDNALTSLPILGSAAAGLQLTGLTVLDASANQITSLSATTFTGLAQLETLVLAENRITEIRPGTFTGLARLNYLVGRTFSCLRAAAAHTAYVLCGCPPALPQPHLSEAWGM